MSLTSCGTCKAYFTKAYFPDIVLPVGEPDGPTSILTRIDRFLNRLNPFSQTPPSVVFTFPCEKPHIFSHAYLSEWVDQAEKPCPNCRMPLVKDQAGKSYLQLLTVFLGALQTDPDTVKCALDSNPSQNDCCTLTLVKFPMIPLRYNRDTQTLYHDKCSDTPELQLEDLARVVKAVIQKRPELKAAFTPTPPSLFRRFRLNYPLLFKAVVVLTISLAALTLNRYQFNGQNLPLSVLGFPAYLTLIAAHQAALAVIFILNSQQPD